MELLAPGVRGITETGPDGELVVRMLWAEQRGNGDVSRWLDTLPRNRRIVGRFVFGPRMRGMLERRGFAPGEGFDMVREAAGG